MLRPSLQPKIPLERFTEVSFCVPQCCSPLTMDAPKRQVLPLCPASVIKPHRLRIPVDVRLKHPVAQSCFNVCLVLFTYDLGCDQTLSYTGGGVNVRQRDWTTCCFGPQAGVTHALASWPTSLPGGVGTGAARLLASVHHHLRSARGGRGGKEEAPEAPASRAS